MTCGAERITLLLAAAALLSSCSSGAPPATPVERTSNGVSPPTPARTEAPNAAASDDRRTGDTDEENWERCRTIFSEADWQRRDSPGGRHYGITDQDLDKNRVVVNRRGVILWNGVSITPAQLGQYLDVAVTMVPIPSLIVHAEPGADRATVEAVREAVHRSFNCRLDHF